MKKEYYEKIRKGKENMIRKMKKQKKESMDKIFLKKIKKSKTSTDEIVRVIILIDSV